jgi:hypothetical protein
MPGTRQATLTKTAQWISSGREPILWLSGIAGTGKSAVMSSLFEMFENHTTRLAAFIRFDRAEFSDASLFVRALAYQLAVFDSRLGQAISEVLIRRPQIISHPQLLEQFNVLVQGPLHKCPELNQEGPIVVLVDGLDECTGGMRQQLLDLLSRSETPFKKITFLRIIVSSRPEEDIYEAFQHCTHVHPFPLDTTSSETTADIEYFITKKFKEADLPMDFLTWCEETNAISELSQMASGLFIWASVAVACILKSPQKIKQLQRILDTDISKSSLKTLDNLYKTALNSIANDISDEDIQSDARTILGAIMVSSKVSDYLNVLTMPILTGLLTHLDVTHIQDFINKLRSIVITPDDDNNMFRTGIKLMHKSLDDFLTDESRCGKDWYICLEDQYRDVTVACLSEIYSLWGDPTHTSSPSQQLLGSFALSAASYIFRKNEIKVIYSETMLYTKLQQLFSIYLLRWHWSPMGPPYRFLSGILNSSIIAPSPVSMSTATKFLLLFSDSVM